MSKFVLSKFARGEDMCEAAGYDAGCNGATEENASHEFFTGPSWTAAWQRGYDRGLREQKAPTAGGR